MELIFEVREAEEGGYVARAPGHSVFAEAGTWEALRQNALEAARLHFEDAPARPKLIRLHLVKDELIAAGSGDPVCMNAPESWLQDMEPTLTTAPELQGVLTELSRRYSRKTVLDGLEIRFSVPHADVWETRDFHCRRLAQDLYLLTYTLLQDKVRLTRRSTIWQKAPDGWKVVYHHGTIVQDV